MAACDFGASDKPVLTVEKPIECELLPPAKGSPKSKAACQPCKTKASPKSGPKDNPKAGIPTVPKTAETKGYKAEKPAEAPAVEEPKLTEEEAAAAAKAAKRKEIEEKVKAAQAARQKVIDQEAALEIKKKEIEEKGLLHYGTHNAITCDGCGAVPIFGYRYRCKQCANHDICENCYDAWMGGKGTMVNGLAKQTLSANAADHSFSLFKDKGFKSMAKNSAGGEAEKTVKVKPNDPCPCGSGKKYKKCCGLTKVGSIAD